MHHIPVIALLAAATLLLWSIVFPSDWSVVPTADASTWATPVSVRNWAMAAVGLAALGAAGGYARGVGTALLGVAVPAVILYCYRSATAEVIGANLWVIGALLAAPAVTGGVALAAAVGRAARRWRARI